MGLLVTIAGLAEEIIAITMMLVVLAIPHLNRLQPRNKRLRKLRSSLILRVKNSIALMPKRVQVRQVYPAKALAHLKLVQ